MEQMRTIYRYLTHSDLSVKLFLNPFAWLRQPIAYEAHWGPTNLDPGLICYVRMRFIFVAATIYVDDGRW